MKKTYIIFSGHPSWHQAAAGHTYAGSIIGDYTPEELENYKANVQRNEPGAPCYWRELSPAELEKHRAKLGAMENAHNWIP